MSKKHYGFLEKGESLSVWGQKGGLAGGGGDLRQNVYQLESELQVERTIISMSRNPGKAGGDQHRGIWAM